MRVVGIAMNGVTGRMGTNQHLVRSILAIREQGGVPVEGGAPIWPEPVLVGRNEEKLRALAEEHGLERFTTSLDEALADPSCEIYFDAAATAARAEGMERAIRAGKHVYCEKPSAPTLDSALRIARLAREAGIKHGVVQDKLFLPGLRKLRALIDDGFFGRILSVRGEFGYWVFEGPSRPASGRPGTTAPRTAAASSRTCCRTGATSSTTSSGGSAGSTRWPRPTSASARTRAATPTAPPPRTPPTPPSSSRAGSSRRSTRPGACGSTATSSSSCRSTAPREAPWRACATAGSSRATRRRGRSGTRTCRTRSTSARAGARRRTRRSTTTASSCNGSCSCATS